MLRSTACPSGLAGLGLLGLLGLVVLSSSARLCACCGVGALVVKRRPATERRVAQHSLARRWSDVFWPITLSRLGTEAKETTVLDYGQVITYKSASKGFNQKRRLLSAIPAIFILTCTNFLGGYCGHSRGGETTTNQRHTNRQGACCCMWNRPMTRCLDWHWIGYQLCPYRLRA